jgi:O-antigen/teichoic acid export membrane protein
LNDRRRRNFAFARLLSSAVVSQAFLSAASFAVGLILIRGATVAQYGYYILALNAIVLLVSLQNAFLNPPLAIRLNGLDRSGRGELVGRLYSEQRRMVRAVGAGAGIIALGLWYEQVLDARTGPLVLAAIVTALVIVHREYFRMVLLAYRRPHDVLRTDMIHVVLLVAGVGAATLTPAPAMMAIVAMGLAAAVSGMLLSRRLHRYEPWSAETPRGILREIAPLAAWSTAGAGIHWIFSQGYIYLVAGTLDVAAVASIAGTRLLLMPVNLLSAGIGSLMLPLASGWLPRDGAPLLWRRLCLFAAGMAAVTVGYFTLIWLTREWLFASILRKQFAQRDELLLLWGGVFLATVVRDQLAYLLAAQGRFRTLTSLTLFCAIASLGVGYGAMLRFGAAGALMGLLTGEVISALGVAILSVHRAQHPVVAA